MDIVCLTGDDRVLEVAKVLGIKAMFVSIASVTRNSIIKWFLQSGSLLRYHCHHQQCTTGTQTHCEGVTADRVADRVADRETEWQTERERGRQTKKQKGRETEKQKSGERGQTERWTNPPTLESCCPNWSSLICSGVLSSSCWLRVSRIFPISVFSAVPTTTPRALPDATLVPWGNEISSSLMHTGPNF